MSQRKAIARDAERVVVGMLTVVKTLTIVAFESLGWRPNPRARAMMRSKRSVPIVLIMKQVVRGDEQQQKQLPKPLRCLVSSSMFESHLPVRSGAFGGSISRNSSSAGAAAGGGLDMKE